VAEYGTKPALGMERVWGRRMYVTIPHENGNRENASMPAAPREWLGYFVRIPD
jgi:hypothetical protein